MKFVSPKTKTASMLEATNIDADTNPHWNGVVSYATDDTVFFKYQTDGSEKTTNGNCSADSFTEGVGWSYDGTNDEYDCDGSQGADSKLYQDADTDDGTDYVIVFEVKNYVTGNVAPLIGGTAGTDVSADGTYVEKITAGAAAEDGLIADSSFVGSVTNISIQEYDSEVAPYVTYDSLTNSNLNNVPSESWTDWVSNGSTNQWKMLDDYVGTQSERASNITIEIDSGKSDYIALFGLEAIELILTVYDNSSGSPVQVDTVTVDMLTQNSLSWSDYFFGPIDYRTDYVYMIPIYANSTIKIEINNTDVAKCGMVVVGRSREIGNTLYNASIGIVDYSTKTTTAAGYTYLEQGNYAKEMDIDLTIATNRVDGVQKALAELRALPVVWIGDNEDGKYESLLVYGFFREFNIVLRGPQYSSCSLEIEGLI